MVGVLRDLIWRPRRIAWIINWTIQPPKMGESPTAPTLSQDSAHDKLPTGATASRGTNVGLLSVR